MPKSQTTSKRPMPLCSVIIINWNNYALTKKCVESVVKNTDYPNYEVWLIDNGSTDKSFEKLRTEFPFLLTLRNDKNMGFPYALNQGYLRANGYYLAPLNNDAIVLRGWLSNGIIALESDKRIAVAGCTEVTTRQAGNAKELEGIRSRQDMEKMTLPVAWVTKKEVVEKVGFLDTEFFSPIYGEEADWNFRARKMGYRVVLASKSFVVHFGSQDTKKLFGNKKQFILMNLHRHRAMLFNLSLMELLRFAPGLGLIFLTSLQNGMIVPLLKSYWLTLKDWRTVIEQRKKGRGFVEFKEPKFTTI